MKIVRQKEFQLLAFICLCVLLLMFFVKRFSPDARQQAELKEALSKQQEQHIPASGIALNPTDGKVPGNPENAVKDLNKIFQFIQVYKQRHGGQYPPTILELSEDYEQNYKAYGMTKSSETIGIFTNPDSKYSDIPALRKNPGIVPYVVQGARPDGRLVGSPKGADERDVIALTDIYYHKNIVNYSQDKFPQIKPDTINPVGFFVVLYDDGTVEKVPWEKVYGVPQGNPNKYPVVFHFGFPGQAGITSGAKTLAEEFKSTARPGKN